MDEQLKQNIMLAVVAGGMTLIVLNILLYYIIDTGIWVSVPVSLLVGGAVGAGTFFIKKSMDG